MQDSIVFQGKSKTGKNILIRYPKMDDLNLIWKYINSLSQERTFIRFQGEEIKLEDEQKFLEKELKGITKGTSVLLLAFHGENLIGISGINLKSYVEKHVGILGISLTKDFRGEGIGTIFIETVIKEAKKRLINLKIIELSVFANNPVAKKLYEKIGFKEFGSLPKGVAHKGEFVDHIYMYKEV